MTIRIGAWTLGDQGGIFRTYYLVIDRKERSVQIEEGKMCYNKCTKYIFGALSF